MNSHHLPSFARQIVNKKDNRLNFVLELKAMARTLTEAELKAHLGLDFFKFLVGLVDDSAEKTRDVFSASLKRPYNSTVGGMMTRLLVRDGFQAAGDVQFTAHEHGFVLHSPRNLGIWFEFEGINGRCYKVPAGKVPLRGKSNPKHRDDFFCNRPPEQETMFGKPWVANLAILWVFDARGNFVQLRGVIGEGWDDEGKLLTALDFSIPTTLAELELGSFNPQDEEVELFKKAPKHVEDKKDSSKNSEIKE